MQWCRQIDTLIYVCLFFSRLQRHSGQSLHWCLGASSSFQATFISSQSTRRNCLKAWTMTLKLQIFLLFLIKTLKYVYHLFFFCFVLFFDYTLFVSFQQNYSPARQLQLYWSGFFRRCRRLPVDSPKRHFANVSRALRFIHDKILFSFVSKSLTFILIPRNKGKSNLNQG